MTIALQFSGGKDSLACLHMYRETDDVVVCYVDSGSPFPGVRDFVERAVGDLGMRLHVTSPKTPCDEWQDEYGYPAEIVPVDASPAMRDITKRPYEHSVVPYSSCCAVNIWEPLARAATDVNANIIVRGAKAADSRLSVPDGYIENGVVHRCPLWHWTDVDVFAYLHEIKADLPPQYVEGCDSLDCWCCTAYMDAHGVSRFAYLKKHHPDLYARAKIRLDAVRETVGLAIEQTIMDVA